MKKLSLILLSIAGLAACNKTEIITVDKGEAIAFADAFVDNSTKTTDNSFSSTNLPVNFLVYGTTKGDETDAQLVQIFDAVPVSKSSGVYTYADAFTQYWIQGNSYNFAALVNADDANVTQAADFMPSSLVYTSAYETDGSVEDTPDLMHATATRTGLSTGNQTVAFTFNHLLANVKFTVENTMVLNPADNLYEYEVTNIQIKNAYTSGKCTLSTKKWTEQAVADKVVKFGNVVAVGSASVPSASSQYARLLIPAQYQLNITFTLTTKLKGTAINVENLTLTPTVNLEAGKAYNLVIAKGNPGEKIEFSVQTVSEWIPNAAGTDTPIGTL